MSYASINEEDKVLLLAVGSRAECSFGIFDTSNGKYLWGGITKDPLTGTPIVKRDVVWSLENEDRGEIFTLVRHTPGDVGNEGKREAILTYPTLGRAIGQYGPSPNGSHFVLVLNGTPSQLLFVPVAAVVPPSDVTVRSLSEQSAPSK